MCGMLMGPNGTGLAPKHDGLMLAGEVGLMLLVLEAGLDVDFKMISKVGARAVGVAVSGSLVPLGIGAALALALKLGWKEALSVGVVLAPTSVGIALNVLSSAQVLKTETGQLIIAAAILDDVIALILLSALQALDNPTVIAILKPFVVSFAWLGCVGALGVFVVPRVIKAALPSIREEWRENAVLFLVFIAAVGVPPAVHYSGSSHLLGAFLAGLLFSSEHHAHHAWVRQVKRVMAWLLTVFFSCTIGFEIPPLKQLFQGEVVKFAAIFFMSIIGKVGTGVWASPRTAGNFFTVGFAMSAWGEFAFVVASAARAQGFMTENTFSACILAVLMSVLLGPLALRLAVSLKRGDDEDELESGANSATRSRQDSSALSALQKEGTPFPVYYMITIECIGTPGLQLRLCKELEDKDCTIQDVRVYHVTSKGGALAFSTKEFENAHNMVVEAVVSDKVLKLPLGQLGEDEAQWQTRHSEVMEAAREAVDEDGASVYVERWIPGMIEGQMLVDADWQTEDPNSAVSKFKRTLSIAPDSSSTGVVAASAAEEVGRIGQGKPTLQTHNPPSQKTVLAHADLELRRRYNMRDERDHGKQRAAHGFHFSHGSKTGGQTAAPSMRTFQKFVEHSDSTRLHHEGNDGFGSQRHNV
eukprot:Tamp_02050.p1 GENE.Tamp_02050~~Tamp_02050.p1  ORF type:complete len:643 (-),score=98.11 Tamp_02050:591-2519(-)